MKEQLMKSAVILSPGEVAVRETPAPVIGKNEIMVKVMTCGVCSATDLHYINGELENNFPLSGVNSYFGHEPSGVVCQVGQDITEFNQGDRVAFIKGGFQQYAVAKPSLTVKIPDGMDFSESLAEPLAVVLHTLDHAISHKGEDVVVLGTGFMGLLLVQGLAKMKMRNIIAVDLSERRLALAKQFGATHIVNATKDRVETIVDEITNGEGAAVVIEAAGVSSTLQVAPALARPEGKIIIHGFYPKPMTIDMVPWHCKGLTIVNSHPATEQKYKSLMARGLELLKKRTFDIKALISHSFTLDEIDKVYEILKRPNEFIKVVVMPNSERIG